MTENRANSNQNRTEQYYLRVFVYRVYQLNINCHVPEVREMVLFNVIAGRF